MVPSTWSANRPLNRSSIVIVHGLSGHPYHTFFDQPTGFYWPRDLPTALPMARVMVFGYLADVAAGSSNPLGVYQHAESLLLHLKNSRVGPEVRGELP